MNTLRVFLFGDLMPGQPTAEIWCPYQNVRVRQLRAAAEHIEIIPEDGSGPIKVKAQDRIFFEPWFMDRGSLLFQHDLGLLKLCTEGDTIKYPQGNSLVLAPMHHDPQSMTLAEWEGIPKEIKSRYFPVRGGKCRPLHSDYYACVLRECLENGYRIDKRVWDALPEDSLKDHLAQVAADKFEDKCPYV